MLTTEEPLVMTHLCDLGQIYSGVQLDPEVFTTDKSVCPKDDHIQREVVDVTVTNNQNLGLGLNVASDGTLNRGTESLSQKMFMYNVSDNPPIYLSVFFGLQQALLSLAGSLSVSLLVADVVCAENDEEFKTWLLSSTLFMNGVTTILMTLFGVRLPLFLGPAPDYVIPLLAMAAIAKDRCDLKQDISTNMTVADMATMKRDVILETTRQLQGSLILAGGIQTLIGMTGFVGVILRFMGPVTIVPAIFLLGIYLMKSTAKFAKVNWGISFMTFAISIILSLYLGKFKPPVPAWSKKKKLHITRYPFHQVFAILIAICIGWVFCAILTEAGVFPDNKNATSYLSRTDARSDIIATASWFYFPYPGQFGSISFSVSVFVGFMIATFTAILDSVGDYYACASMCRVPPPKAHAVNRGILIEGLCSAIAGTLGCGHATTTYGGNIGAIGITKVASRQVFLVCGVIYILFGVIGKISAVFICIPYPVLGGALITMYGMFTGVVLSNLKAVDLDSTRNLAIIGTSIFTGMMIPYWIETFPNELDSGTKDERGIAIWQNIENSEMGYVEGYDIYYPLIPKRLMKSRVMKYLPFMPNYEEEIVQSTESEITSLTGQGRSINGR
ncbi:hypothetical protein ACJMK2_006612 [Sinanodonta woodiana]|uniref:Solute carrier family 23 member 2 n=1 Tax=Sinanodonta woodiana TaxID=1069815 RepID=A0ABD3VTS2_SINWO